MRPQRNSQQNKRKNTIKYVQIFAIHFFEFYFGPWCLTIRRKQHSNTMTRVALNQIVLCWKFQDIENQIFLVHSWQQLFWFVFYFSVFITFSPNHSVSSDACSLVRLLNTRFTITTENYIILFVAFFVPHTVFFLLHHRRSYFCQGIPISVTGQNVINE